MIETIIFFWAFAGLYLFRFIPGTDNLKSALKQWFFLGPFFWVGVPVYSFFRWLQK